MAAIKFDRNELAGAFGDIGTDLPLLVGMTLAAGLDGASVLTMFGVTQVLTALFYRLPMPVQPLKAMAAIVITQKIAGSTLYGAGLAIGAAMFLLSITGFIDLFARVVPKPAVRGVQLGLGLQLAQLALKDYVSADGAQGYALAVLAFLITLLLIDNRRYPAALFVMALGTAYAFTFKLDLHELNVSFNLPRIYRPAWNDVVAGFLLLALPQIPLSLSNSILATRQVAEDLFPESKLTVKRIGLTYSAMNLISPFLSGVPVCHGSGGMAGHYAFGGRTGGSVIIYGLAYILLGVLFGSGYESIVKVFPLPVLGVMLLFEGLTLMLLIRDCTDHRIDFTVTLLTGLIAASLPYGYLIGLVTGTLIYKFQR